MTKKTIILICALIVLSALAYFYNGPWQKWQEEKNAPKNFLQNINIDNVDKIEVIKGTSTPSILVKVSDGNWKVGDAKGFGARAEDMNNTLDKLKAGSTSSIELISTSKNKQADMGVGASGTRVKIYQGAKSLADFIVGKMGSNPDSTYVALPNSDNTYLIKVNLSSYFTRDDWRDTTIFAGDKTKITKIRFQYPDREFTIEKKDGKWAGTLPNKFAVKEDKVTKVLDVMASLTASKIPEQKFTKTGLEKNSVIVEASGDGIDNLIMLGNKNGEDYYAKKGDSDNIYLVNKSVYDTLNINNKDLN
jgi:hypothetical protein